MAFHDYRTGTENLSVAAAEDLRAFMGYAIHAHASGVWLSGPVTSGQAYFLANKPNSGEAVKAYGPGNVVEARAGGAITLGAWVTCAASGLWVVGSKANAVGTALEAVASGASFALRLV